MGHLCVSALHQLLKCVEAVGSLIFLSLIISIDLFKNTLKCDSYMQQLKFLL